ncbi:MAG: phage major capsid protein [Erythrobacter sp.]|nr:phage major capsid protein [Erythrobacter sp.]MDZ4274228.1 phage major capsid protein [Erythrobacter sp.]
MRISALKQSLAATVASMEGIIEGAVETVTADADGSGAGETIQPRDLTAEEQAQFDALKTKATGLQAQIAREEQVLALKASAASPVIISVAAVGTVPAAPKEQVQPGIMMARIAQSFVIGGGDQRAMAHAAEQLYGSEMGQIVANMEQATNTKGGFLVDTAYSADFIDILRPRVVIRRMGARTVPMPDGNLTTRRKTGGTTAGYIGERVPAPVTAATVGQITMSAKRLAAIVPITNQLIRRASLNVQMMIRDDLVEGVSVKEDQQFLRGAGSATAPTGLRNLIAAGNVIAANATVNLVNVTNDLGKLRLAVLNANIPMTQCGYIMSARTMLFLENLRDGNGNKAFPEIAEGRLGMYPIGVTTSVPDNLGAGTNESEIYFGDFAQFMIGDTEQVAIAASDTAAYDDGGTIRAAFSNDETVIRVITEHDTQMRYDTAFAVLTGVTWAM